MTKEQIEDLNQLSRDHYWTDGARDDLRKALPRLLEERQRLLGALRAADQKAMWQAEQWAEAGGSGGPEMRDYLEAKEALKAAIAFAKEEAK